MSTRVERMRQPLALDVAKAAAEQHGVCVRPFTMETQDRETYEMRYVAVPCGSTVESVCGPCARRARALRVAQCREGWHMDTEPDLTPSPPTADQTQLVTARADLVAAYRELVRDGSDDEAEELREAIADLDAELRQLGVRGRLPSPDLPARPPVKRSTRRRQDTPNLPRRPIAKHTIGREYAGRFRPSMFVTLTLPSYGRVRDDGTPVDPDSYDYRRAARDAVHFAALVDRWWQNLRLATLPDLAALRRTTARRPLHHDPRPVQGPRPPTSDPRPTRPARPRLPEMVRQDAGGPSRRPQAVRRRRPGRPSASSNRPRTRPGSSGTTSAPAIPTYRHGRTCSCTPSPNASPGAPSTTRRSSRAVIHRIVRQLDHKPRSHEGEQRR